MRKIAWLSLYLLSTATLYAQKSILVKNITLIDVEKGTALKNANVLVRGQLIENISFGRSAPNADSVIDGRNRFLMPGLWDMHTHVWSDAFIFPVLIANGVTGIRDMFDNMYNVKYWRGKIADGKIAGPEITAAGPIVDGPMPFWPGSVVVTNAEEGRKAVDSIKNKLQTDFVKVYSKLSRESYFAIAEEAKKQQIPFEGHVPYPVTVVEAAAAGQKSQEHLYGFLEAASDSADYLMQVIQGKITDTTLRTNTQKRQLYLRTFNPKKLESVLQQMKQYDCWICPTMTVNYGIAFMGDTTKLTDPRLTYVDRYFRTDWNPRQNQRFKSITPALFEDLKKEFDYKMRVVQALDKAGVPILAGTDFPNPYCFPGFSIHDELQWLVKAGLTPARALQAATINGARFCKKEALYGSITTGKMADLLILEGNPLTDIANTKKIYSVVVHGKVYDRAALDNMLEDLKKKLGN